MYNNDNRIVITLDAGGTNFVFGAIQGNKDIIPPFTLPSRADNLDTCMASLVEGFTKIINQLQEKPVAISFAFPGPADSLPGKEIRHPRFHQQRRRLVCIRRSLGRCIA